MYIAHNPSAQSDQAPQSIAAHSMQTAALAKQYAIEPLQSYAYLLGLLHDVGKYQPSFQRRIGGADILAPHALCGAQLAQRLYGTGIETRLLQYCIAGHHAGLPDGGLPTDTAHGNSLYSNLCRPCEDYSAYAELPLPNGLDKLHFFQLLASYAPQNLTATAEYYAFLTRYCFSCLTDADSIDTEQYTTGKERQVPHADFTACLAKLDVVMEQFPRTTALQQARDALQQQAYQHANATDHLFLLNLPTGAGKTLCSMKFALLRALATKKKRIIYIIPYNSIIDQTAQVFTDVFGEALPFVRHQSSFFYQEQNDLTEDERLYGENATENWDADCIITTAVQFFESLHANKRRGLRKLHNLADSILIFDEAHMMPLAFLEPCLKSILHITHTLNTDSVFLTATMPDFPALLSQYADKYTPVRDLVADKTNFAAFAKCHYQSLGLCSVETLLLHGQDCPARLIICNTKKEARALFAQCSGEVYHLSTYMTGFDRQRTIATIRKRLAALNSFAVDAIPRERYITVIATSLIEAGVDLDFYAVYRADSGLDHILQSGGRCDREGKRQSGCVYIFSLEEKVTRAEQSIARGIFNDFADVGSNEAILSYYQRLWAFHQAELHSHALPVQLDDIANIPFRSYAQSFQLIADDAYSVVVPQDDVCQALRKQAEQTGFCSHRKVQPYTVSLPRAEFNQLQQQGVLADYDTGVCFLTNLDYYDAAQGILLEGKDQYW